MGSYLSASGHSSTAAPPFFTTLDGVPVFYVHWWIAIKLLLDQNFLLFYPYIYTVPPFVISPSFSSCTGCNIIHPSFLLCTCSVFTKSEVNKGSLKPVRKPVVTRADSIIAAWGESLLDAGRRWGLGEGLNVMDRGLWRSTVQLYCCRLKLH